MYNQVLQKSKPQVCFFFFVLSYKQTHTQLDRQTATQTHRHADGHEYSMVAVDKPHYNNSFTCTELMHVSSMLKLDRNVMFCSSFCLI